MVLTEYSLCFKCLITTGNNAKPAIFPYFKEGVFLKIDLKLRGQGNNFKRISRDD